MKPSLPRICAGPAAALLTAGTVLSAVAQTNGFFREFYQNGIAIGNTVASLTNNAAFPDLPVSEAVLDTVLETPANVANNYGQRLRALITAPSNGPYRFWISSDDSSVLYLGTNSDPAGKTAIAGVNGSTGSRVWTTQASQVSATQTLVAGEQYYLEILHAEGAGNDHVAVRWQLPGVTNAYEEPIPAARLTPYGMGPPRIRAAPASTTVTERAVVTFAVDAVRSPALSHQWQLAATNLPGATGSNYTYGPVTMADSGRAYRCVLTNDWGSTTSTVATLSVLRDATAPTLAAVNGGLSPTRLTVTFSEDVDPATATNRTNYRLNGRVVTAVRVGPDGRTVLLTTDARDAGTSYTLTVRNVRDLASTPNVIAPGTSDVFVEAAPEPMAPARLNGAPETPGPSSRRTGLAITEILYHPAPRDDGRNLEFVELRNTLPYPEPLGGCRFSGEWDYVFPSNTVLGANGLLVVAAAPADVQAVYWNATNVLGGFTKKLNNGGGTLRLENELGAVLLDVNYGTDAPWPAAAAGGAGHSLVLHRPSYGEGDPRAWTAGELVGGTPGEAETPVANPLAGVQLNEILAHTDLPDVDYVELFNAGTNPVDVAGCVLTDDASTNKFVIPAGTTLPARGFVHFTATQLGFAMSAGGETVWLKDPAGTRVIDAVRFGAQQNGVAWGRSPDGGARWGWLADRTPGGANGLWKKPAVVINELMYHPLSEDDDDEYVELYNRTPVPVALAGWQLQDGISYTFPSNAVIGATGYVVVARSAIRMQTNYPGLSTAKLYGDYDGSLADGGERIALSMPEDLISTNSQGGPTTNWVQVVVDEVTWSDGGRWGKWSDGGGSSLELIDPEADRRLAPNWADSDETAKSGWTTVEFTGALDQGSTAVQGVPNQLHVILLGAGECLLDDVEVVGAAGTNLLANGTFEAGTNGWFFQGSYDDTGLETAEAFAGGTCLHVRGATRGDTGANRVRATLTAALPTAGTATLRAKVRWLKGWPEILLRARGNWIEALGWMPTTRAFGTPGARNSRAAAAGPAVFDVTHEPVLPAAGQAVTVSAQVDLSAGLDELTLCHRLDSGTAYTAVPMINRGAGLYSAALPGAAAGRLAAFHIRATGTNGASARFPADAPAHEGYVRFGEIVPTNSPLGAYRLWVATNDIVYWTAREKNSNKPLDATFVYNAERVVYNASTLYGGSPFHSTGLTGPLAGNCDYVAMLPPDNRFLGDEDLALCTTGNLDNDRNGVREQTAFWMMRATGAPYNHRRYVHVYLNGVRRSSLFEDAQQPNSSVIKEWFPDDSDGDLYKIEDWFEFDDAGQAFSMLTARLLPYTTTGGGLKTARYRWNWRKRAVHGPANNYTNLFQLVATANVSNDSYTARMDAAVDERQWMRIFAVERFTGNYDSYGYNRGKNMFAYKPEDGPWHLLPWDIDFGLGSGGGNETVEIDPANAAFPCEDPVMKRFFTQPAFLREWWRAVDDVCRRVTVDPALAEMMTARHTAITGAMVAVSGNASYTVPPSTVLTWIANRRNYILGRYAGLTGTPFAVTSPPDRTTTNASVITLGGTAVFGARTIHVNGLEREVTWTTVTNWTLAVGLTAPTNTFVVQGIDENGVPLAGAGNSVTVFHTGAPADPRDSVGINELMYNPAQPGGAYVEVRNTSTNVTFDLSGWRLDGVDFTFPGGTMLPPAAHRVVVENIATYEWLHGTNLAVIAGQYAGRLDRGGETLKLVQPGATPAGDVIVDEVTYDDDAPWPREADGFGASLQLINPDADHNRVANWAAAAGTFAGVQTLVGMTNAWRYYQGGDPGAGWAESGFADAAWPSGRALLYAETAALPAPKNTPLALGRSAYYFRTSFVFTNEPAGVSLALSQLVDDGVVCYLNGLELSRTGVTDDPVQYASLATRTVGDATLEGPFAVDASALVRGTNVLAAEVHQNQIFSGDVVFGMELTATNSGGLAFTPAASNVTGLTLSALPPLWLNEVQPRNTTGAVDRAGEREPWVELFNSGTNAIHLAGFHLAGNYTNLTQWAFPADAVIGAGEFLVVWLDGEPGETASNELHASFRPAADTGSVALSTTNDGRRIIVDYLNYAALPADRSWGAYPDGAPAKRRRFYCATPGAANRIDEPAVQLSLNEWMASNTRTATDPADGDYDDWFELHNAGAQDADLSGYTLTDDLSEPDQYVIPDGTTIPAGGFLLVWADNEPEQTDTNAARLHVNFSLKAGGEALGLFKPDGTAVDTATFGAQTNDISQGRWPDGAGGAVLYMPEPTPGATNRYSLPNRPPQPAPVADAAVDEETTLTLTVTATDPDAVDVLAFSLAGDVPEGAVINPESGVLTWTPTEAQGPAAHAFTVRVTDNGSPARSADMTFMVTVREVNRAPVLGALADRTGDEAVELAFSATAVDPDLPPGPFRFRFDEGAPAGAAIDPESGAFSWTPTEAQGPGTYAVTIVAYDPDQPDLNTSQTLSLTVREVNAAPTLAALADRLVWAGQLVTAAANAGDSDFPTNTLGFSLAPGAPPGAGIDPVTGVFAWTALAPVDGRPATNAVTVRVTDNGVPPLTAERTFQVVVPFEVFELTDGAPGSDDTILLRWTSLPGRRYRIEWRADLATGGWTAGAEYPATGPSLTVPVDRGSAPHRHYRVVELP